MKKVAADFDRIALLEQPKRWGHNKHYHRWLLHQISHPNGRILEVGCGQGEFCECLAPRASQVIGIDLSANMIAKAQAACSQANVTYQVGDYLTVTCTPGTFDYIFSIATLHHFSLAVFLEKAKRELKPGGKLVVLDLCHFTSLADRLTEIIAVPANWLLEMWHNFSAPISKSEQRAWHEHQASDHYLTLLEVKAITSRCLPAASIKRRLFWRYSLVWTKPIK